MTDVSTFVAKEDNLNYRKTKDINLLKKLEELKFHLKKNTQPRLAWEIIFLKISMECG